MTFVITVAWKVLKLTLNHCLAGNPFTFSLHLTVFLLKSFQWNFIIFSYFTSVLALYQQEAFEKCWAHSPLQAAACRITIHKVSLLSRRMPPVHRCPRRRQRVTEGTAMAPWNGPNYGSYIKYLTDRIFSNSLCYGIFEILFITACITHRADINKL